MMRAKMVLALCVLAATPALAQNYAVPSEKSATKPGFAFPAAGQVRILLLRPDLHVSQQTAGGLDEPKGEWVIAARTQLVAAIGKVQAAQGFDLIQLPEQGRDADNGLANYMNLFRVVIDAAMSYQLFPGNRLPTKANAFSATLGQGSKALLPPSDAEYGLFVSTTDSYPSPERLKMEAIRGDGANDSASAERKHIGYAALVELSSGDIVWINTNVKMRGAVYTSDGAQTRVAQLLRNFPSRAGANPVKAK